MPENSNVNRSVSSRIRDCLLALPIGSKFTSNEIAVELALTPEEIHAVPPMMSRLFKRGIISSQRISATNRQYVHTLVGDPASYFTHERPGIGSLKGRNNKGGKHLPAPEQVASDAPEIVPSTLAVRDAAEELAIAKDALLKATDAYEQALYKFALACTPTIDLLKELERRESQRK